MINMVIFCIFYLNRDNIVIKSSSINKPMRYSDKKHVKNGKKISTFSCRYVSKLESNKLSLLQIILLK